MSRIHPVDPKHAPADVANTLLAVKNKLGIVPNLLATLARAPAALNAYLAFSEALSQGTLSPRQREVVALAVAQANACGYCLSAHTLLGKATGLAADEIAAARRGTGASLEGAIARFATQVVKQRGLLSDSDIANARREGVEDPAIVEIVGHVALNILSNYVNHIAATDIDFPEVAVEVAVT